MCICDEGEVFVLAKVIPLPVMHNVIVGKVVGLYHALGGLSDIRFDNVDFGLDSKSTMDAFNNPRPNIFEFGLIISACRSLFHLKFTNSKIRFNRRQATLLTRSLKLPHNLFLCTSLY
jgi:hypothetical protein